MKLTYRGSCHCGKIRYEADIDLDAGTGKCNCSICWKKRYWGAIVKPDAFRLQAEEVDIADYQFGSDSVHHRFCKTCGIAAYGHGYIEAIGGAYYSVNVATLDDVDPAVLAEAPVQYMDGRNNNWFHPPAETRHL
ncbi:GFA family protein [Ensifer canadensis]